MTVDGRWELEIYVREDRSENGCNHGEAKCEPDIPFKCSIRC